MLGCFPSRGLHAGNFERSRVGGQCRRRIGKFVRARAGPIGSGPGHLGSSPVYSFRDPLDSVLRAPRMGWPSPCVFRCSTLEGATLMNKLRYSKPGTAPATLVAPPDQEGQTPEISLVEYDAHTIQETKVERIDETLSWPENGKVSWINISGLGDVEMLRQIGLNFRIHPLALEDMLNNGERPKLDEYENQLFIVLQMAYSTNGDNIVFEQVSMVLGKQFVITVQEKATRDVFGAVR